MGNAESEQAILSKTGVVPSNERTIREHSSVITSIIFYSPSILISGGSDRKIVMHEILSSDNTTRKVAFVETSGRILTLEKLSDTPISFISGDDVGDIRGWKFNLEERTLTSYFELVMYHFAVKRLMKLNESEILVVRDKSPLQILNIPKYMNDEDCKFIFTLKIENKSTTFNHGLALSKHFPNAFYFGLENSDIALFNFIGNIMVRVFTTHRKKEKNPVHCLQLVDSKDEEILVCGCFDNHLYFYNTKSERLLRKVVLEKKPYCLSLLVEEYLMVGENEGFFEIFEIGSGGSKLLTSKKIEYISTPKNMKKLTKLHKKNIYGLKFQALTSNSIRLFTSSMDTTLKITTLTFPNFTEYFIVDKKTEEKIREESLMKEQAEVTEESIIIPAAMQIVEEEEEETEPVVVEETNVKISDESVLTFHRDYVTSLISFPPNILISGSKDKSILVYDTFAEGGTKIAQSFQAQGMVNSLMKFSDRIFVSGDYEGNVYQFVKSGTSFEIKKRTKMESSVRRLLKLSSKYFLVVCKKCSLHVIKILESVVFKKLNIVNNATNIFFGLVLSNKYRYHFYFAKQEEHCKDIVLFDVRKNEVTRTFDSHVSFSSGCSEINCLEVFTFNNEEVVLCGSEDKIMYVYNSRNERLMTTLKFGDVPYSFCKISNNFLVVGGLSGSIAILDVSDSDDGSDEMFVTVDSVEVENENCHSNRILDFCFNEVSRNKVLLFSGSMDKTIKIRTLKFPISSEESLFEINVTPTTNEHSPTTNSTVYLGEIKFSFSKQANHETTISLGVEKELKEHLYSVNSLLFIPRKYLISGGWDHKIVVRDISNYNYIRIIQTIEMKGEVNQIIGDANTSGETLTVFYTADGKYEDGHICKFSLSKSKFIKDFEIPMDGGVSRILKLSEDLMLVACRSTYLRIVDVKKKASTKTLNARNSISNTPFFGLVLSKQYKNQFYVATKDAFFNHEIVLYDYVENKKVKEFAFHTDFIHTMKVVNMSGDCEVLLAGCENGKLYFYDTFNNFLLKALDLLHKPRCLSLLNEFLLVGEDGGFLEIFEIPESINSNNSINIEKVKIGNVFCHGLHSDFITDLNHRPLSNDEITLFSSSKDKTVRISTLRFHSVEKRIKEKKQVKKIEEPYTTLFGDLKRRKSAKKKTPKKSSFDKKGKVSKSGKSGKSGGKVVLKYHSRIVNCLLFVPPSMLISGGCDSKIIVKIVEDGKATRGEDRFTMEGSVNHIIKFNENSVFSADDSGRITGFKINNSKSLSKERVEIQMDEAVKRIEKLNNNNILVVCSNSPFQIVDVRSETVIMKLNIDMISYTSTFGLLISQKNQGILISRKNPNQFYFGKHEVDNNKIVLFDIVENDAIVTYSEHNDYIFCLDLFQNSYDEEILIAGCWNKLVYFYNSTRKNLLKTISLLFYPSCVSVLSNKYLLIGEDKGSIEVFQISSKKKMEITKKTELCKYSCHKKEIRDIRYYPTSDNSVSIFTASSDRTVQISNVTFPSGETFMDEVVVKKEVKVLEVKSATQGKKKEEEKSEESEFVNVDLSEDKETTSIKKKEEEEEEELEGEGEDDELKNLQDEEAKKQQQNINAVFAFQDMLAETEKQLDFRKNKLNSCLLPVEVLKEGDIVRNIGIIRESIDKFEEVYVMIKKGYASVIEKVKETKIDNNFETRMIKLTSLYEHEKKKYEATISILECKNNRKKLSNEIRKFKKKKMREVLKRIKQVEVNLVGYGDEYMEDSEDSEDSEDEDIDRDELEKEKKTLTLKLREFEVELSQKKRQMERFERELYLRTDKTLDFHKKAERKDKKDGFEKFLMKHGVFVNRSLSDYVGLELIQRNFGDVYFGYLNGDHFDDPKIIKVLDWSPKTELIIKNEIEVLLKLKGHPAIVPVNHVFKFREKKMRKIGIEMDYFKMDLMRWMKGKQFKHSKSRSSQFSSEDLGYLELMKLPTVQGRDSIRRVFKKVLEGISYIHKQKIQHRDLKPENILLNSEFEVKIIDFGIARDSRLTITSNNLAATRRYLSPEVKDEIDDPSKTPESMTDEEALKRYESRDMYAFGLMLLESLIPSRVRHDGILSILKNAPFGSDNQAWIQGFGLQSTEEINLLKSLLHPNAASRISADEALKSKLFGEYEESGVSLLIGLNKQMVDSENIRKKNIELIQKKLNNLYEKTIPNVKNRIRIRVNRSYDEKEKKRKNIVDEVLRQSMASCHKLEYLLKRTSTVFLGESGVDAGGVSRELYSCIFEQVVTHGYSDRIGFCKSQGLVMYLPTDHKDLSVQFFRLGKLLLKCLLEKRAFKIPFGPLFYAYLLDQEPVRPVEWIRYCNFYDPQYINNLEKYLNDSSVFQSLLEDETTFLDYEDGKMEKKLTHSNRREYIINSIFEKMQGEHGNRFEKNMKSFKKGFNSLLSEDLSLEIRSMLNPFEMNILCFGDARIQVKTLIDNIEFPFNSENLKNNFEVYFNGIEPDKEERRRDFFRYCCGSVDIREGILMRDGKQKKITIRLGDKKNIVMAHTCGYTLEMSKMYNGEDSFAVFEKKWNFIFENFKIQDLDE